MRRFGLLILASAALILSDRSLSADDLQNPALRQRIEDRGEIEKLLTDHTLYGRYIGGQPWSEYHAPDGRTAYRENNCTYPGHWWTTAGLVCFRYEAFNDGRPACFQLYRHGERLEFDFRGTDGNWKLNAYSVDRRLGNPDKLPLEGQACVGV